MAEAARGAGAGAAAAGASDIARDIGLQVEQMIMRAKNANQEKVSKEIFRMRAKMEQVTDKVRLVQERLARTEASSRSFSKADFEGALEKLEEQWDSEVDMVKNELFQTIQAHNHNADLLKHHKEAIDQVKNSIRDVPPASPEQVQVHDKAKEMEKNLQWAQGKEQSLQDLMARVTHLQRQIAMQAAGAWTGMGPAFAAQAAAAQAAAAAGCGMGMPGGCGPGGGNRKGRGKDDAMAKKAAKASAKKGAGGASAQSAAAAAAAAAHAASLRAEAPEFVPTAPGLS